MRNHRQYRTKIVRQMRRQIFRQMKQKAEWILDVFTSIFVKYDGKFASRWRAKSTDALCAVLPIIIYTGDFPLFCPIRRYFLLGDKNSIQYHVADSHAAAFSTGSLSLRYTALLLPMDPLMIFTFISGWKEFFDCFSLLVCQTTFVMTPTEFRKSQG